MYDKAEAQRKWRAKNNDKRDAWRKNNPEAAKLNAKRYLIKKKYGITLDEWNVLFESQGRACKICRTTTNGTRLTPDGKLFDWSTDHCHETNKVRGILCNQCNFLLGLAKDDIEILKAAIVYLEGTQSEPATI